MYVYVQTKSNTLIIYLAIIIIDFAWLKFKIHIPSHGALTMQYTKYHDKTIAYFVTNTQSEFNDRFLVCTWTMEGVHQQEYQHIYYIIVASEHAHKKVMYTYMYVSTLIQQKPRGLFC